MTVVIKLLWEPYFRPYWLQTPSLSTIVRLPDTVVPNNPIRPLHFLWALAFGCMRASRTCSFQQPPPARYAGEGKLTRRREKYVARAGFIAVDDLGNLATYFIGKGNLAHLSSGHLSWTSLGKLVKCLEISEERVAPTTWR